MISKDQETKEKTGKNNDDYKQQEIKRQKLNERKLHYFTKNAKKEIIKKSKHIKPLKKIIKCMKF